LPGLSYSAPVEAILDNYCRASPLDSVYDAFQHLIEELMLPGMQTPNNIGECLAEERVVLRRLDAARRLTP
jgi:hypothetical protein